MTNQDFKDILRVEGINSKGFGIIPKIVMQDRRLTRDAKAIYAYFRSYAGAGTTAFPSVSKICYDLCFGSEDTYRKHFKLLTKYGYIAVQQERAKKGEKDKEGNTIGGLFKHNIYTLVEKPEEVEEESSESIENAEIEPTPKNQGTVEKGEEEPTPKDWGPDKWAPENRGYNNNSFKNNSFNNVVVEETDKEEELALNLIKKINELNFKYKYTFSLNDIGSLLSAYSNDLDLIYNALDYMLCSEPKKGYRNFIGFLIKSKGYKDTPKEFQGESKAPTKREAQKEGTTNPHKTKFHLENSRRNKYTAEELEEMILAKSREQIEKYKK